MCQAAEAGQEAPPLGVGEVAADVLALVGSLVLEVEIMKVVAADAAALAPLRKHRRSWMPRWQITLAVVRPRLRAARNSQQMAMRLRELPQSMMSI